MEYRTLGRTGIRVSAIGLGCEGFTGKSAETVVQDIDLAQSLGINFIECYSPDPELRSNLGYALKERRDRIIVQGHLCTSWENGQYVRTRDLSKTKRSFDDLLKRLKTDFIDVGMIHYIDGEEDFHTVFEGEIIKYAQELKDAGKIRSIGLSSHNPRVSAMAVRSGLVDVLMFSVNPCYDLQPAGEDVEQLWANENYAKPLTNMDSEREELYELCERGGVGIDVMKAFGGGDLLSETDSPFGKAFTPVQCIEYALTRPAVASVMAGCRTRDQITAAAAWCDSPVGERDYTQVMRGLDLFTWNGHCMYCGHCALCPAGISVASVTKYYNLARNRGDVPETVRDHYLSLPRHASDCIACGACEPRCPFGVGIRENMRAAAKLFGL